MSIEPDHDYYYAEMHRKNMIETEKREKESVKWEWRHIFDPTRHSQTYSENTLETHRIGKLIEKEGFEIIYVYSPTTFFWNDHGQQLTVVAKSRAVLSDQEVIDGLREKVGEGDVVVLLSYMTGLRGIDSETGDRVIFNKIRYDIVSRTKKVEVPQDGKEHYELREA